VVLLGEMTGSGYRSAPSLVRRPDGQTIQLTRLLYLVLESIDGQRSYEEIAQVVSAAYGRAIGPQDVRTLTETRLAPLGLLRGPDGSEPELRRPDPLLALRLRWAVSDAGATRRMTAPFAVLFAPVVVAVVVVAFAAVAGWLLFTKGLASATYQAFDRPLLLLAVLAITVLSAGFHEFGHAAACRYGGATPGVMGMGLYLVWPAFYTDVTDSYRLGRGGRLRVDLGGLYFNAVLGLAMFGVWAATRWDALLLILAAQLFQMVRQLAPMVRFDGYHTLADLTGVPDLFARIGPTLRSLVPGRTPDPRAAELKAWARAVVTVWVLLFVPLMVGTLVLMVLALPRVLGTALNAVEHQTRALTVDYAGGDVAGVAVRLLALLAICLPVLGTLLILTRLVRRTVTTVWQRTTGRPVRRAVAGVVAGALVAGLAAAWWPDANRYRPIQPFEHGTLRQALSATSPGAPQLRDGQIAAAPHSVWAASTPPPTRDHPQLALVLLPKGGATSGRAPGPAWVFPFNRPGPPGEGDNQALAVNTTDGSSQFEVAFALVWADGSTVTNTNEAYAFARCTACQTVAIAFQVVLVVGSANIVVPQNLSGALNYSCIQCVTYALAQQLVLTVPGVLSNDARAQLDALWQQIAAFAAHLKDVPLDQIRSRLLAYQDQITALVTGTATPATSTSPPSTGGPAGSSPSGSSGSTTSAPPGGDPTSQPVPGAGTPTGGTATTPGQPAESSTSAPPPTTESSPTAGPSTPTTTATP
jgi:putative peptide zinc metalloprotease protein